MYAPSEDGKVGPTVTGIYGQQVTFPLGNLITAIISFLAVAAVVYFVFVLPMNKFKEIQAARAGVTEDEEPLPTEQELLVQIRDLLEKTGNAPAAPATRTAPPQA